jgi:hypothetical protein
MKNKSTYSLLINADAEEKGRSIFETAVYMVMIGFTAISVWMFASGPVVLPGMYRDSAKPAAIAVEAPAQPIALASRG